MTRTVIKAFAKTFSKDEDGATAIEYGLFAALVGAVIVGSVSILGGNTQAGFAKMNNALNASDATTFTADSN
jgi:pilus assembly protein Flp/PilA